MSSDWERNPDWLKSPDELDEQSRSFFDQQTRISSTDSETLAGNTGAEPPPPPPPPTDPFSVYGQSPYPSYDGPPPFAPPGGVPVWPAPVAPSRGRTWLFLRVALPLVLILLVCAAGAGIGIVAIGSHTVSSSLGLPSSSGAQQSGPTIVSVGEQPTVVINRNAGAVHISPAATGGKITIQASGPNSSFDNGPIPYQRSGDNKQIITFDLSNVEGDEVDLTVPPATNLNITTNGDDIVVDGLSGQIQLSSNGGALTATHMHFSGNSSMETNAGAVTFQGTLDPAGTYKFDNNDGAISLTFPANASFHLDATINGGMIHSDFSEITISQDEAHGTVGSAPYAQVTVSTNAGSISIYKG